MNFESVLLAMVLSASAFGAVAAPLAEQIERALLADTLSKSARPVSASERRIAQAVYADDGFAPRWLTNDSAHQVTPLARVAIALMGAASDKGLVASDYRADGFAAEAAPDPQYVSALAAPDTIDTIPEKTLHVFADHGRLQGVMPADDGDAQAVLSQISRAGVDIEALAAKLQQDGAQSFVKSWQQLLQRIAEKARALAPARA